MEQDTAVWVTFCSIIEGMEHWLADQAGNLVSNVADAFAVLHLSEGIDSQVLATINSIVAAMMVVIFNNPPTRRPEAQEMRATRKIIVSATEAPRVAFTAGVLRAGWCCIGSTLLMTIHRPEQNCLVGCTSTGDEVLMVIASLLTTFGCYWGSLHFLQRFAELSVREKEEDKDMQTFTPRPGSSG